LFQTVGITKKGAKSIRCSEPIHKTTVTDAGGRFHFPTADRSEDVPPRTELL
jgi:hypothetical protein